jgi:hypothetical protein
MERKIAETKAGIFAVVQLLIALARSVFILS